MERVAGMTHETRIILLEIMRSQAYCELMSANILGHSLKYVPEFPYKVAMAQMIEDELDRYQQISRVYGELSGGQNLFEEPDLRLSNLPYPENWFELGMVQFLFDRSSEYQLREYIGCRYEPYARVVRAILRDERLKASFGEKILRGYCKYRTNRSEAQRLFNQWLTPSLMNLVFPDPGRELHAIGTGLKAHESTFVIQEFIQGLKPAMRECGLKFPQLEKLDVALPADLDLSL